MTSSLSSSTSSLSLFLLVVIASISVSLLLRNNPNPETLTPNDGDGTLIDRRNHVVRFVEYKPWRAHRDYLRSNLVGVTSAWDWIERDNPAKEYPTDFGVVWIAETARERVVAEIGRLGKVKDVNADVRYGRVLLNQVEDEEEKKKLGKMFTAFSFAEEARNESLSWKRELLAEVVLKFRTLQFSILGVVYNVIGVWIVQVLKGLS